jgi:hypothetical protein
MRGLRKANVQAWFLDHDSSLKFASALDFLACCTYPAALFYISPSGMRGRPVPL